METAFPREPAQRGRITGLIPRNMQRNSRRASNKLEDRGTVLEFLVNVPRFTGHRKTGETRSAGSDTPGRNGDAQRLRLRRQVFNIDVLAMQLNGEVIVVLGQFRFRLRVVFRDECIFDLKMCHRRSPQETVL